MAGALPQQAVMAPSALQPQPLAAPALPRQAPHMQLDLSQYAVPAGDQSANPKNWERRADGTKKGLGFLGLLKRPDGKVSSEISIGVPINGKETEIPTIVPTLTQHELDYLLTNPIGQGKPLPNSIIRKAVAHAHERVAAGKSPFADAPTQGALP